MLDTLDLVLAAAAAVAAGAVNAIAGGGTLLTFPMLIAIGVPAVAANVTNTVALCPGYLGAAIAQRDDLAGQKERLRLVLPAAAIGGVIGAMLLLHTGERTFRQLVPYLILLASLLLALQDPLRAWLVRRRALGSGVAAGALAALLVAMAAVYGGYFGAGLSVIVLAVLGVALDDSLTRLNALKQAVSLVVNVAAAGFFLFSGQVVWSAAAAMAVGALAGGTLGGRLAGSIRPSTLRWTVVTAGVTISAFYFVRG